MSDLYHEGPDVLQRESAVLPKQGFDGRVKWAFRVFDLLFALLCLPFVVPLLLVLALIVKIDNPRLPAFYVQPRYGLNGRKFRMFKIRTMVAGAENMKSELMDQSEDKGASFKVVDDPRITRPGRWIRKTYLDEVPQIWNVLCGDMSIVGPRANSQPPESYEPWQRRRLSVAPGITGSWQVMEQKPWTFATRCKIDIEYIAEKSLWGDMKIIYQTLNVCLLKRTGC